MLTMMLLGARPAHATWNTPISGVPTTFPTAAAACGAWFDSLAGSGLPGNEYQWVSMDVAIGPGVAQANCHALVFFPPGYTSFTHLDQSPYPTCTSPLVVDGTSPSGCAPANGAQSIKQLGSDCDCSTGDVKEGEPIAVAGGNVSYKVTDYETAGQNKLSFIRYYNSRDTFAGSLENWHSNFDRYLYISPDGNTVRVQREDGKSVSFQKTGGVWVGDTDVDFTVSTPDEINWTVTTPDDTVETYVKTTALANNSAYLTSSTARNGYAQTLTYDSAQRLLNVTDSYNRSLTFGYNSSRQLVTVTTPDSLVLTYSYTSGSGGKLLTGVSYNTSPATNVTYNYAENSAPASALTSVLDENGSTYLRWTYDAYGRGLTSASGTSALNANQITIAYNDTDGSRTVTNAFGVTDTYTFTTLQGVPKVTQISRAATSTTAAATESFGYDSNGYLNSIDDWNGNQTTFVNNGHGMPTTINEAVGSSVARTTTITYDPTFVHLPDSVTTAGLTTAFTYDSSGEPLTKKLTDTTTTSIPYSTNGQTRTWTYTWSNSLLASVKTPRTDLNSTTSFGYTGAILTSITDAAGHVTNITSYTNGGCPETIVDPNGVTTTLTYDPRQRLTSSAVHTSSGTLTTTYTVDPTGEVTQITPPAGRWRQYAFDAAHRLTTVTNRYEAYIQDTLDALGDTTQEQTIGGSTVYKSHTATFDALGRKLTDVGGAGQTTTYTYDTDGNALTIADGLNQTTTRTFDALNRLSTSTDASSGVAQWTYDAHNRVLTAQDQNGHTTSYVYDGFGDVIQETSPDRGTTVYYYDKNSNPTSKTDALGIVTNQRFDALDRRMYTTYPANPTLTSYYYYDQTGTGFSFGIGRLTSVLDPIGPLTFAYDERGNLLTEKRTNANIPYTTSFGYDAESKMISETYPDGTTVNYQYDYPGTVYIVSATPAGGTPTTIATNVNHLPFGPLNHFSYGNGIWEHWYKDLDYRTTSLTAITSSGTGSTVMHLNYGYDAANNVKTITDYINPANSQTLTYDVLNRIKTAVSGSGGYGNYTYTFDPVGNLTSLLIGSTNTNYTYTSGTNRLASVGGVPVTTDADGNITSAPIVGSSSASTFTYTVGANRLGQASGGGMSLAITSEWYDAFGQRFVKWNTSGGTQYFYDQAGNMIEEQINGQNWDYVYVDGVPIAVIHPGASPSANQINYITHDRLGTPQMVFNSSATQVWNNTYTPFGQGGIPVSSIVNDLRLPGQVYDMETGFHYNRFRDYMPNLGRYLESDPIGLAGGLNSYLYALGNPSTFFDPNGLQVETESEGETSANQGVMSEQEMEYLAASGQSRAASDTNQRRTDYEKEWGAINSTEGYMNDLTNGAQGPNIDLDFSQVSPNEVNAAGTQISADIAAMFPPSGAPRVVHVQNCTTENKMGADTPLASGEEGISSAAPGVEYTVVPAKNGAGGYKLERAQ